MKSSRFAAVFAVCVGILMILMWSFFIATGQVPEYRSRPAEITLHLIDEFLTALLLLIAGAWALRGARWAAILLMIALGMLFYTLIVSPGYYIQQSAPGFVAMFALLFILGVAAAALQGRRLLSMDRG